MTTKLRALLVDDEPLARERLRALLSHDRDVEIAGECTNGTDAIATIRATPPDVVFLDMEMPGCCGLQVLAELKPEERPAVVFATAHECFALDAFEVEAADYLLKPFDLERLQTALQRARRHLAGRRANGTSTAAAAAAGATMSVEPPVSAGSVSANANVAGSALDAAANAAASKRNERLTVKADGRLVFLRSDDIVWVEAADNYVILHLLEGRLMVRETMSALETRLGTASFARVNRSAIVHLDQIKELQPTQHGDYVVLLRDGSKLPLSRSLRGQLGKFAS